MKVLYYALAFASSFAVSALFIPVLIRIAKKFNVLDYPTSNIKTHKSPVPYLGGLAVAAGFFVSLVIIRYLSHFPSGTLRNLRGIIFGSLIMLIVGFIDDLIVLHYSTKFLWQALASLVVMYFGVKIEFVQPAYFGLLLSMLWIIGVTNALNIIDVMDGLSSGVAIIASLFFFFVNLPAESVYVNFSSLALAGGLLGFWIYNRPDAKIYMGDAGALFTGFVLSSIALGASYSKTNDIALYGPILILGIPIYETLFVMWARYSQNKLIFLGSKDHFALRLLAGGWTKKKILVYTYSAGVILGLSAFLITKVGVLLSLLVYAAVLSGAIIVAKKLVR